jgi:hypothetical protein
MFAWQAKRAEYQKRCIEAIRARGGYVRYDFQTDEWHTKSSLPAFAVNWLGVDFFHRVTEVRFFILLPCDWDADRDLSAFGEGCLAIDSKTPDSWERWGGFGKSRKIVRPQEGQLTSNDWARAALRQVSFGCDRVTLHIDYCRKALELDPDNVQANLLLGEYGDPVDPSQKKLRLETVLGHAPPESLEYAQAKKMLAGEVWTFAEICHRIGPDGALH